MFDVILLHILDKIPVYLNATAIKAIIKLNVCGSNLIKLQHYNFCLVCQIGSKFVDKISLKSKEKKKTHRKQASTVKSYN